MLYQNNIPFTLPPRTEQNSPTFWHLLQIERNWNCYSLLLKPSAFPKDASQSLWRYNWIVQFQKRTLQIATELCKIIQTKASLKMICNLLCSVWPVLTWLSVFIWSITSQLLSYSLFTTTNSNTNKIRTKGIKILDFFRTFPVWCVWSESLNVFSWFLQ